MPWPPATGRPQRLAEAEMGSIQRSGILPPIDAGPSGPCLTSVPRSRQVGTSAVNVLNLPVSLKQNVRIQRVVSHQFLSLFITKSFLFGTCFTLCRKHRVCLSQ